jgi:hypothetical protein
MATSYSTIDPAFKREDKISDIERDALLQFVALDFCILQEFRRIRHELKEQPNIAYQESELPTDAYRIPAKDIAKLIALNDDDVIKTLENHYVLLALQTIWAYAVAYPQTIYDLRENQSLDSQDLITVYETTDGIDKEIGEANEQKRKASILRRLDEANPDETLPERIKDLSLNIALMIGKLTETGTSSETAVINLLFRDTVSLTTYQSWLDNSNTMEAIISAAGLTEIFESIKNYPVLLDRVVQAWGRIFPEGESSIFDMLYNKVSNLENNFRNSQPAESQKDYRQEALDLILNQLKKWITEVRLQELWNLSRNTSATLTLSIFRSLKALNPSMIFDLRPAEVLNVTATAVSNTQIRLSWNHNTERDLVYYNIYRGNNANFDTRASTRAQAGPYWAPATDNTFLDTPPQGGTYFYKIRAVNQYYNMGTFSREASATIPPGAPVGPVPAMTNTTTSSYWSVRNDETGRLGWLYTLYFALKPTTNLFELYEFAYENTSDDDEIKRKIKVPTDAGKLIPSAMFPAILDTATLYPMDNISALNFDRIQRTDRALEDKVKRKGGLKALLTERKVRGVL